MSEISDAIQANRWSSESRVMLAWTLPSRDRSRPSVKCLAFGDRIIKLNDYLLKEAANKKPSFKMVKGKRVYEKSVPVYLQSVSALCNQLLRSGTSIGANNAEAINAISKQDFRSKSYIALKEARESLYWLELLHRNNYLTDVQFESIYADAEELVRILVSRCKKLDAELITEKWFRPQPSALSLHYDGHMPQLCANEPEKVKKVVVKVRLYKLICF